MSKKISAKDIHTPEFRKIIVDLYSKIAEFAVKQFADYFTNNDTANNIEFNIVYNTLLNVVSYILVKSVSLEKQDEFKLISTQFGRELNLAMNMMVEKKPELFN